MDATEESTLVQPFAHLTPHVRHISQSTIRKKWKPLPQSSQDRVRAMLLSLKTKRAASGRIPLVGVKGNPRTKKSKNEVMDQDYERAVEEVTNKSVSQSLPPPLWLVSIKRCTDGSAIQLQAPIATTPNAFSY